MKSLLGYVAIAFAAIGLMLSMPVLLPFLAVSEARRKRRLHECASTTKCEECEQLLGAESLALSSKEWRQYVDEIRANRSGVRFRMVRLHDAICSKCKAQYKFDAEQCELVRSDIPHILGRINHERRGLRDSPHKRALRASLVERPTVHGERWLIVYDTSPRVLYDREGEEYALLHDDDRVTVVGDIGRLVESLANSDPS